MKTSIRYILSFLLIAMICIGALAGGSYILYGDYSRNQIEEKFLVKFSAAQIQADQLMETLLQYEQQLSQDLISLNDESETAFTVDSTKLVPLLNNFETNVDFPVSLMVFVRSNPQWIYTSSGVLNYWQYEDRLLEEGINPEDSMLYSRLLTASKPIMYCASPNNSKLILILPLGSAWSAYPATLVMMMDESVISDYFNDIGATTSLYAMDTFGQLVLLSPAEGSPVFDPATLYDSNTTGIETRCVEGENWVFLRQPSSTGLITYVSIVPEHIFYQRWYELQRQLMLVVCLVGGFAVALSLVMGYTNYLPVRNAYRMVTGNVEVGQRYNELDAIVNHVAATRKNISELEEHHKEHLQLLKRQFLLGLINGSIKTSAELEVYLSSLMLDLSHPLWLAMFLPVPDDISISSQDDFIQILDSCSFDDAELLFTECRWENGIGLVVNFSTEHPREEAGIAVAQAIVQHLFQYFGKALLVGAGSVESSPFSISTSFYRATGTVKKAQQDGRTGAVAWHEPEQSASRLCLDTALLAEGITYGNVEVADAALRELLVRVRSSNERIPLIHLMCSDILNTVIRFSQKQNLPLDKTQLCAAAEFQTIDEFYMKMQKLINQLCAETNRMRVQDSVQSRSRVIAFIAENYKRNDLSLKLLSDEMGMSMAKINMVLKENLGCSFVQYISLLRLNEVKRLLRETDDSIQVIIQSVGYFDASSFVRKFKQMEGISPGQYRSLHRRS